MPTPKREVFFTKTYSQGLQVIALDKSNNLIFNFLTLDLLIQLLICLYSFWFADLTFDLLLTF